ncbi:MAG: allantoinase, partial [Acinetobacter sp.]|nr:allantoinase [Acinetobacter sp.]
MSKTYLRGQDLIDQIQNTPYSRDLIGYHGQVPKVAWPNQAQIAVQFVLNYEEGAENHIEHGDAGS